jgi:hypothetical protein
MKEEGDVAKHKKSIFLPSINLAQTITHPQYIPIVLLLSNVVLICAGQFTTAENVVICTVLLPKIFN